jgi:pilus assembly protein TadC
MFGGAYLGLTAFAFFLRYRQREYEREVMFQMPIFLESLILLVESGLGILPALERVVPGREYGRKISPVTRLFQLVYQLSASGMPFTQALETVAEVTPQRIVRHVLLHLDISGTEGGELVPSLRNLSDHAHMEWKLSVEQRVRRLENLVVFPVFASVLGLMVLTAAVPVVPLLNLKDILDKKPELAAQGSQLSQGSQPFSAFPMRGN